MDFRVHRKVQEGIKGERRDIALISAPGMGLSTLFKELKDVDGLPMASLQPESIIHYWDTEFKGRSKNRRFVIHSAVIMALIESKYLTADVEGEKLFRTNLPAILADQNSGLQQSPIYIVIDGFNRLPDDLALIVCKEMKWFDDHRTEEQYKCLNSIRFIIGGAIDFANLFSGGTPVGVSPATNFHKYRPYEFLLSLDEATLLIETILPRLERVCPGALQFVIDFSGGYLHYVLEFARWIMERSMELEQPTIQTLINRLRTAVEEQDRIPLFKHCYSAWEQVQEDDFLVGLLTVAVKAGHIYDSTSRGRKLAGLGILIEKPAQPNVYYLANRLVEIFFRQRLAERQSVLPIEDGTIWTVPNLNAEAYKLILEIENRLRSFIGDRLFDKYHSGWVSDGLRDVKTSEGHSLMEKVTERFEQDQKSIYAMSGIVDCFLTFLDFPDLTLIVEQRNDIFSVEFSKRLSEFLDELNYYRRRVAHNRPMTLEQIENLESRWLIIRKIISTDL